MDTHQCEEMICTDHEDCEGFDQVCNEAHDNCFYCGGCEGLGCCPGCHDTALNCKPGEICNMDSHLCENPNECESDEIVTRTCPESVMWSMLIIQSVSTVRRAPVATLASQVACMLEAVTGFQAVLQPSPLTATRITSVRLRA